MQNNRLLRATTASATTAGSPWGTISGGCATGRWRATATTTAAVSNHAAREGKGVVIGHFQIPGDAAGLGYPRDHFAGDHATLDHQFGRIANFRDRTRDLS